MSNSQRGDKRTCPSCGVRFYDLARKPIVCPGCESEFSVDDFVRPRRQRAPEPSPATPKESPPDKTLVTEGADESGNTGGVDVVKADDDDEGIEDIEEDEDDESVIEDASELGEDDDDMAEVIVNVVEPKIIEER